MRILIRKLAAKQYIISCDSMLYEFILMRSVKDS